MASFNRSMREANAEYIIVVPGRLGSQNRDWGLQVDYRDVDHAAAIFEFGVDVAGRTEPLKEPESLTGGGIYGTHFLTNLISNNVVYGFIQPLEDVFDPWLFSPPAEDKALYVLTFPKPVSVYADSSKQKCVVLEET